LEVRDIAKFLTAETVRGLRRDLREAILEVAKENAIFKATVVEGYRITIPDDGSGDRSSLSRCGTGMLKSQRPLG
jgi:hypothetical protein